MSLADSIDARLPQTQCTRCGYDGCRPVDAIVGAPKLMHTVVEAECTGCELCLPPCPVDCIEWVPRQIDPYLGRERATRSRQRFELRTARLQRQSDERESKRRARTSPLRDAATMDDLLARVRARAGKP